MQRKTLIFVICLALVAIGYGVYLHLRPDPWELTGSYPAGSLGAQIQDAQRRAKRQ